MARQMKDSGIAWIGEIPTDWTMSRVGLHYDIILGKMLCTNKPNDDYTLEPYYCAANIHFDGISDDVLKEMWFSSAEKEMYIVKKGDLLVVEGGAGAGGCANVSELQRDMYIQNSVMIARPKAEQCSRFLRYLIEHFVKSGYIDVACNKATIPHFTKDKLANVPIPLSNKQRRIAAFLDAECARIDAVIEKTRASIEEYKKLKQSVITEAVTKGIRSGRKMKDSGIEWIGEIPEEWSVSRVGLHFDIILGKMLCSNQPSEDYSLEPYYCAANVHFDGVSNSDIKQMWFSKAEKEQYSVCVGDLLVVEGGAGAGGCALVADLVQPTYIQNSIMIVRSKGNAKNGYLRYLTEYLVKQGYIDVVCNKATIPHFTKDKLANVPFLVSDEQAEIAEYLDVSTAKIDSLITKKDQFLMELESYKKSLIFEYVTGKKEVAGN